MAKYNIGTYDLIKTHLRSGLRTYLLFYDLTWKEIYYL